jgi:hypothetical protein
MLGIGKLFLVIVYINANSPKRDKDVLTNGNNGLFKILKKKKKAKIKKFRIFYSDGIGKVRA